MEKNFAVIGEAMTRCKHHFPGRVVELGEIKPIIDFRNYLIHRYDSVDSSIVWEACQVDLPPLRDRMKHLLDHELRR